MPKLIFRAALIRFVDLRYDEKSKTVYTKINFTAAWTEPIRQAMEWGEPPEGFGSAKLDGEFTAITLEMIPNGELKHHAFDLETKQISSFEFHRVQGEDGESTENQLRFQITTTTLKAAQKCAAYLAVIGKGEAQLKVTYEAQGELNDQQERLISEEQSEDTADDGAPLAPAAMMGGTHQKGSRKKTRGEPIN